MHLRDPPLWRGPDNPHGPGAAADGHFLVVLAPPERSNILQIEAR